MPRAPAHTSHKYRPRSAGTRPAEEPQLHEYPQEHRSRDPNPAKANAALLSGRSARNAHSAKPKATANVTEPHRHKRHPSRRLRNEIATSPNRTAVSVIHLAMEIPRKRSVIRWPYDTPSDDRGILNRKTAANIAKQTAARPHPTRRDVRTPRSPPGTRVMPLMPKTALRT